MYMFLSVFCDCQVWLRRLGPTRSLLPDEGSGGSNLRQSIHQPEVCRRRPRIQCGEGRQLWVHWSRGWNSGPKPGQSGKNVRKESKCRMLLDRIKQAELSREDRKSYIILLLSVWTYWGCGILYLVNTVNFINGLNGLGLWRISLAYNNLIYTLTI